MYGNRVTSVFIGKKILTTVEEVGVLGELVIPDAVTVKKRHLFISTLGGISSLCLCLFKKL